MTTYRVRATSISTDPAMLTLRIDIDALIICRLLVEK
jgi:hypothetical protein